MKYATSFLASAAFGITFVAACGVDKLDAGTGDAQVPAEIQRIFETSCGYAPGCHNETAPAEGLVLTGGSVSAVTGTSAQSGLPIVEFGNVEGSYMAIKLLETSPPSGTIMPPSPTLSDIDRAILIGWIGGATLPAPETGGVVETGGMTDDAGATDSSGGEDPIQLCSVEEVVTDGEKTIDAGVGPGQVPPDIAETLVANCGCHLGTDLVDGAAPSATPDLTSLAGITSRLPQISMRLNLTATMPSDPFAMPPPSFCNVGGGTAITDNDLGLLQAWVDQMAPDGADWEPNG